MNRLAFRRRGFTLIELMVVLAIISILITLAVPRLTAYYARSKQSEVKTNLGALKACEESSLSEKGYYSDNLLALGFTVTGSPVYIYGFTSDDYPSASGLNDTAELRTVRGGYSVTKMINSAGMPLTQDDLPAAAKVTASSYSIGAAGNIDQDPTLDEWILDKDLGFEHVVKDF